MDESINPHPIEGHKLRAKLRKGWESEVIGKESINGLFRIVLVHEVSVV